MQDTFGIVSAVGMPGVRVGTPQGPVRTDPWGQAIIPQLSAYSGSRVEVDTHSLPRNVDIRNGFRLVDAGRGSVNFVDFDLMRVRRLLLTARDADGRELPSGAYVLDARKQFISTVPDRDQVFLSSRAADGTLTVALPGVFVRRAALARSHRDMPLSLDVLRLIALFNPLVIGVRKHAARSTMRQCMRMHRFDRKRLAARCFGRCMWRSQCQRIAPRYSAPRRIASRAMRLRGRRLLRPKPRSVGFMRPSCLARPRLSLPGMCEF